MLRGECILCFAPDLWTDIWRNRHRLLGILARENRVLYVEPRCSLRYLLRQLRKREIRWRDFFRPRVEEVRENLFVYHDPLHLPRVTKAVLGPLIERLRDGSMRRVLRRLGFDAPILWLVRPNTADLPGKFGEKALLYQIVDDYGSFSGAQSGETSRRDERERRIAERADLVIVTSETLLESKRDLHSNVHLVRNAVDEATLAAGCATDGDVPPELASRPRPIHGYIGGVTNKVDLDLLAAIARKLEGSGGTLLLVGPVRVEGDEAEARVSELRRSAHVHFTGKRPADEVPAYLRAMDVCLVPYALGSQARAIDPLKLYEYLAFGKPVVSVDIPSVRPFSDVVSIAEDQAAFLDALDRAIAESGDGIEQRRRELARENSWEERVRSISSLLEEVLQRKRSGVAS